MEERCIDNFTKIDSCYITPVTEELGKKFDLLKIEIQRYSLPVSLGCKEYHDDIAARIMEKSKEKGVFVGVPYNMLKTEIVYDSLENARDGASTRREIKKHNPNLAKRVNPQHTVWSKLTGYDVDRSGLVDNAICDMWEEGFIELVRAGEDRVVFPTEKMLQVIAGSGR